MKLILRIIINAVALWLTARLIPAIGVTSDLLGLLIVAVIFGLINAFIRPIVRLLTLPLSIITLGLFSLVINALMLLLTAWLTDGLTIAGGFLEQFFWALVGGVVISIVSTVLNWFLPDKK